jgi:hypothetical protein
VEIDKEQFLQDLNQKGRAQLQVKATLFDASETKVLTAIFDWFIAKI